MTSLVLTKPMTTNLRGFEDFEPSTFEKVPTLPGKEVAKDTGVRINADNEPLRPVLDFQEEAPSPSQTMYQICVYPWKPAVRNRAKSRTPSITGKSVLNRDKMKYGCVVLRDWPRKRYSQAWTRGGAVNPSERVIAFDEFLDGEMDSQLISIFGQNRYNQIKDAVNKELENRKKFGP